MSFRPDSIGFFWQDTTTRPKIERVREMPSIPETGWRSPMELPNLAAARALSIDCETFDPELTEAGPGWGRGKGHIVGVAVGTDDGHRWYFPLRHETEPWYNLDPNRVMPWLKHEMGRATQPKIGANLTYDYGWLLWEGVELAGDLHDVQYAEALLHESGNVNLQHLGSSYLGEGKTSDLLYQWLSAYTGCKPTPEARKFIYKASPRMVGPYAESDADLPFRVASAQWPLLEGQGLLDLYRMECDLIPLLVRMRLAGVSVDVPAAERFRDSLIVREAEASALLRCQVGFEVNVNAPEDVARAFDREGLAYNRTEKTGAPSFRKEWLETMSDVPLVASILEIRKLQKLRSTFVEGYILNKNVGGKVFCSFHPLRADEGGTRSGRFSSSDPNLQNIPSRDEELAPAIRGLFIPDEGHRDWRKFDYSQIEYRFLTHFAVGNGADELRAQYIADPMTDYHVHTQELVRRKTGKEVKRKPIKNINFGLLYGMGEAKLSRSLNLSEVETTELFEAYHEAAPYVKATMSACAEEAEQMGYITTVLGRRSRFDLWEPRRWSGDDKPFPLTYFAACDEWGSSNIRRSGLHKAINRRLQGSAADQMKKAMLLAWRSGVFEATGVPRLTVHDELDFSNPGGRWSEEGFRELKRVMETAIALRIPVVAEAEKGPNWGHVEAC